MIPQEKINYLEFPSRDLAKTKAFFSTVFNWTFTDYGPEYTAFSRFTDPTGNEFTVWSDH